MVRGDLEQQRADRLLVVALGNGLPRDEANTAF